MIWFEPATGATRSPNPAQDNAAKDISLYAKRRQDKVIFWYCQMGNVTEALITRLFDRDACRPLFNNFLMFLPISLITQSYHVMVTLVLQNDKEQRAARWRRSLVVAACPTIMTRSSPRSRRSCSGFVLDGRFVLEKPISRSGMATIYPAKDTTYALPNRRRQLTTLGFLRI